MARITIIVTLMLACATQAKSAELLGAEWQSIYDDVNWAVGYASPVAFSSNGGLLFYVNFAEGPRISKLEGARYKSYLKAPPPVEEEVPSVEELEKMGVVDQHKAVIGFAFDVLKGAVSASPWFLNCGALSPDGSRMFLGKDKTVEIWEFVDGDLSKVQALEGHEKGIKQIALSTDGQFFVSASDDKTLRVWVMSGDGYTFSQSFTHKKKVKCAAVSPDGKYVVAGDDDKTVKIYENLGGEFKEVQNLKDFKKGVKSVAFSADGSFLAAGSDDKKIRIYERGESGFSSSRVLEGSKKGVYALAFSPDGKLLASGGKGNMVKIWDLSRSESPNVVSILGHYMNVRSLAFRSDGEYLVSGSDDATVRIWRLRSR